MNSNLDILDEKTDFLIKQLEIGFMKNWSHKGYIDFILFTIKAINEDIHLLEENNIKYDELTHSQDIIIKILAVLSDTKNLLLLGDINTEVNEFLNEYLILVSNWNQIINNSNIDQDIQAIIRIFEIQNSMEGLLVKANMIIEIMDKLINQSSKVDSTQSYIFSTSSTYLRAVKDSLKRNRSISETEINSLNKCE